MTRRIEEGGRPDATRADSVGLQVGTQRPLGTSSSLPPGSWSLSCSIGSLVTASNRTQTFLGGL